VEIFPGVHRIETEVGRRALYQFLFVAERMILIDTGLATTPEQAIFPYLESIGLAPERLGLVIITHADCDHHGGIRAVKARVPHVMLSCGLLDRSLVEEPQRLLTERYGAYTNDHGLSYPPALLSEVGQLVQPQHIDLTWVGSEIIRVAPGWDLRIVAAPGHSSGHLAIHDLRHDALFSGDAVQGTCYPGLDGAPAMVPNYVDVDAYLATIQTLEQCSAQSLHGAHWPAQKAEEVTRFLADSREYAKELDHKVIAALQVGAQPISVAELIELLRPGLRCDLAAPPVDFAYSVVAHLDRLVRLGSVEVHLSAKATVTYSLVEPR
jgi:glyoxylase-like metal-dependent hydrolase (beta-lactamase superfamily II)